MTHCMTLLEEFMRKTVTTRNKYQVFFNKDDFAKFSEENKNLKLGIIEFRNLANENFKKPCDRSQINLFDDPMNIILKTLYDSFLFANINPDGFCQTYAIIQATILLAIENLDETTKVALAKVSSSEMGDYFIDKCIKKELSKNPSNDLNHELFQSLIAIKLLFEKIPNEDIHDNRSNPMQEKTRIIDGCSLSILQVYRVMYTAINLLYTNKISENNIYQTWFSLGNEILYALGHSYKDMIVLTPYNAPYPSLEGDQRNNILLSNPEDHMLATIANKDNKTISFDSYKLAEYGKYNKLTINPKQYVIKKDLDCPTDYQKTNHWKMEIKNDIFPKAPEKNLKKMQRIYSKVQKCLLGRFRTNQTRIQNDIGINKNIILMINEILNMENTNEIINKITNLVKNNIANQEKLEDDIVDLAVDVDFKVQMHNTKIDDVWKKIESDFLRSVSEKDLKNMQAIYSVIYYQKPPPPAPPDKTKKYIEQKKIIIEMIEEILQMENTSENREKIIEIVKNNIANQQELPNQEKLADDITDLAFDVNSLKFKYVMQSK